MGWIPVLLQLPYLTLGCKIHGVCNGGKPSQQQGLVVLIYRPKGKAGFVVGTMEIGEGGLFVIQHRQSKGKQ